MDLSERISEKSQEIQEDFFETKETDIPSLVSTPSIYAGNVPAERKMGDYLRAAIGWVYACIGVISDEIALIKIRLYRRNKDGSIEEVLDHPALDIVQRANTFTTKFDHFWMTMQYLELCGEAPWFVYFNAKKQPEQLLLLRPDMLQVVPGKDGAIIGGYKYRVGSKEIDLNLNEVVFLRYPDPDRLFRGRGPLQAAARTVDIEEFSEEYNRRFFFNSARPDGVLSTEQKLGTEQMAKLERKLAQKYKGIGNAHKTLILEKGLTWQNMALTQKDMEYLEGAKFSRDKILGIFRVPKNALGLGEDLNRATAEATDFVFARRTIKPKMERLIQQMNEFLLPLFQNSDNLFYDFDDPVPENVAQDLEVEKAGLQYGFLTINEVRAEEGYEPVDGGDTVRVPLSNAPIDQAGDPFAAAGLDHSERIASMKARTRNHSKAKNSKADFKHNLTVALAAEIEKKLKNKRRKARKDAEAEPDAKLVELQQKQLNIADEFEKRYTNRVKSVFRSQKETILARMPKKSLKAKKDIDWRQFLLLPAQEKQRFAKELSDLITSLIIQQSAEAFLFIGIDRSFDADNPAIASFLEKRAFKFATPTTNLTNRLLGQQFREGIAAGESMTQLRDRVSGLFSDMESYRAARIARSETIRTTNFASEESYKQSGVVLGKQWLVAYDERLCEWCSQMANRVIGLGENYFEKGDQLVGSQGGVLKMDFGNTPYPPLHANCRCTLVPVVSKSAGRVAVDEELSRIEKKLDTIKINNG